MRSGAGHTHERQGRRVVVHLRDGTKVEAIYKAHRSRTIEFLDRDPIPTRLIRTIAIVRGPPRMDA